ncbi:hypothetical protein BOTBODRAFT_104624 [Botryobasidium botryosum FD-172 SS1]|uniref:Vacuolar import and degradation protein n=1 Tax=Botryobasidium botryosum (strain FD-172 SS1) TaxID=930990 RepID=A0A067MTD0_BOTB1|nr:hypothetical protein BOTBODRAFT_104624 [Botryobasidium botryosum FD-172 SS1]
MLVDAHEPDQLIHLHPNPRSGLSRVTPIPIPSRSSSLYVQEPGSPLSSPHSFYVGSSNTFSSPPASPRPDCDSSHPAEKALHSSCSSPPITRARSPPHRYVSPPDPYTDITRIRVRSQGQGCLYPGAKFDGTQKSGRNSYDVSVTIVDVDFSASTLCGYLTIKNLTEDWPQLTTYFDAEIIGSRYGFLTQDWGANEQEDLTHWARFPAFRPLKSELRRPNLTMKDRDRGVVFMRWKERFLVPDHRVRVINGASFAGFYYVCVEFNPTPTSPSHRTTGLPQSRTSYSSRDYSSWTGSDESASAPGAATMTGFYFHQHSEPYQQLSLAHVPDRTTSSFEFR